MAEAEAHERRRDARGGEVMEEHDVRWAHQPAGGLGEGSDALVDLEREHRVGELDARGQLETMHTRLGRHVVRQREPFAGPHERKRGEGDD